MEVIIKKQDHWSFYSRDLDTIVEWDPGMGWFNIDNFQNGRFQEDKLRDVISLLRKVEHTILDERRKQDEEKK